MILDGLKMDLPTIFTIIFKANLSTGSISSPQATFFHLKPAATAFLMSIHLSSNFIKKRIMEVVVIEETVFVEMREELEELLELFEKSIHTYLPIFNEVSWLDNQEVCLMLGISKRTLQSYQSKGVLPYSKLNRKNYFKLSDVKVLLENLKCSRV